MSVRFDWPALMRAGMQGLGLKPAEFWALTPVELRLMLGERTGVRPMARAGLEVLLRAFPDEHGEMSDG
ncbi:MAG: rcc01693 family protein [Pseudomonadota bacterium]